MNTSRFLTIPAKEYHDASRCGRYMSSHNLAAFRESPELYRRKTSGEIAESESPALALGRPLGRLRTPGDVARLRSVGCRAGAAPELRRGRFNRKGETHPRFALSVKSGGAYRGRTDDLLHAMQAL